jgi:hypothetical protein
VTDLRKSEQDNPAFWGPISFAIPVVFLLFGFLFVADASSGVGGDMVGPGVFVYAEIALGGAGIFGVAAAIRAVIRRERWITLACVGLLLNLVFVIYGAICAIWLLR